MDTKISDLTQRMKDLEGEIELEAARRFAELRISVEGKKVRFEAEMLKKHRELRTSVLRYLREANILTVLTAPVIYSMIVPFALLDLMITLYQAICFPVYGIKKVKRGDYLMFDRARLRYLNIIEKVNCAYCSYGNGVVAYAREVSARTELYWCPIKHARRVLGVHGHYTGFSDFGDAEAYRKGIEDLRKKLAELPGA